MSRFTPSNIEISRSSSPADFKGFHKNKNGEKLPETEEDLLEHRTDGSDAFDTLYIGCEKFPQHEMYSLDMGGVV